MSPVTALSFLLPLALLITSLRADQGTTHFINSKGYISAFTITDQPDYCLISKSLSKGHLLFWNTSSHPPVNPAVPKDIRDRLEVLLWQYGEPLSYIVRNVTESDSGLYTVECWTDGKVSHQDSMKLTVCSVEIWSGPTNVLSRGSVELRCDGAGRGNQRKVQWFKNIKRFQEGGTIQNTYWVPFFLDEIGSLNPLLKHLEGRVQVAEKGYVLRISNVTSEDVDENYDCMVLDGQGCIGTKSMSVRFKREVVYQPVGKELILPCSDDERKWTKTLWYAPHNNRYHPPPPSKGSPEDLRRYSEIVDTRLHTHVTDGNETGDYSLVIPSPTLQHSGEYDCRAKYGRNYLLMVCPPDSDPLTTLFSDGEEVTLGCASDPEETNSRILWFRQTSQKSGLLLDTWYDVIPDDLRGRANLSPLNSLVLSRLSLADSGEYWCAVYGNDVCTLTVKTTLSYNIRETKTKV